MRYRLPSCIEEKSLRSQGYQLIAGIDEVGRGALMGPVMAAAVIMPEKINKHWKNKIRDSKQLTPANRDYLFDCIYECALSIGIGASSNNEIDTMGISKATRMAMVRAIRQLKPQPHFLLIDYLRLPELLHPQKGIPHGDSLCFSIACASIIAKVTRDRLVTTLDNIYPGYGLAVHKGYGTGNHLKYLREKGPCPLHRRSFSPIKEMVGLMP